MTGEHRLILVTNRIKYSLDIKRNITVIRGDSATGKTTLIKNLAVIQDNGNKPKMYVECDVPFRVYTGTNDIEAFRLDLTKIENGIVFMDEEYSIMRSKEFANIIKNSTNYFVLITRVSLDALPYSVKEVYYMTEDKRYSTAKTVYNTLKSFYFPQEIEYFHPDVVITEDKNSGNEFMQFLCENTDIECIASDGKSNVYKCIKENIDKNQLIIVDGAAFGADMEKAISVVKYQNNKVSFFMPESFEEVLLRTYLLEIRNLKDILDNTVDYVDSRKYFSWERFFTDFLVSNTKGSKMQYNKSKLNDYYKSELFKNRVYKEYTLLEEYIGK